MLAARGLVSKALLRPLTASVTSSNSKATLPDLSYDYSALEPVISAEIMQLHHSKHHQTYVNNYNVASEKLAEAVSKGYFSPRTILKVFYPIVMIQVMHQRSLGCKAL